MGYYGIIPREIRESTAYATVKICIGLIVLISDLFCIWGLIKPIIDRHIDKNGESVTGIIESVRTIPHPKYFSMIVMVKKNGCAALDNYGKFAITFLSFLRHLTHYIAFF